MTYDDFGLQRSIENTRNSLSGTTDRSLYVRRGRSEDYLPTNVVFLSYPNYPVIQLPSRIRVAPDQSGNWQLATGSTSAYSQ